MKSTIDLDAIQAFAKIVQTGSFTRAALALDTHKAHLSRVIGHLERELGARLLERTTRSLSLTEVGREFHERAVAILAALEDAQQAVAQSQGEPRGTLRLTCGVEFGMLVAGPWINQYLAQYPHMKVEAEITARIVDLVHEGFDLAIRVGPLPDSALAARRLGTLTYALYAAPRYVKRRGVPRSPEDLAGHDLLMFTSSTGSTVWQLGRGGESRRVRVQPRFRATNSFAICDAAASGLGVAVLPRLIGDPLVSEGRLRTVLDGWSTPEVPVSAVFASARFLAPKVRTFVDLAYESFAQGRT
jgi:LysR family transcriptional regulator, regulator for bpeEF and oprC